MRKFVVGFILIMLAATVSGERGEHEGHGDRR